MDFSKQTFIFNKNKFLLSDTRQNNTKKIIGAITAIVLSFFFAIFITCIIQNDWSLFAQIPAIIFGKSFNDQTSVDNTISSMAILIVGALSFLVAFKAGLFNMGISGQMIAGATIATIFAQLVPGIPTIWGQILLLIISSIVGMCIGGTIGILKAYLNVNEVVSSIMINWIIYYLSTFILKSALPSQVGGDFTNSISSNFALQTPSGLSFLPLIIVALILTVFISVYLKYTIFGKKSSAVGLSKTAAKASGYNVEMNLIWSMMLSGLIAGILGVMVYCGKTTQMPLTNSAKTIPIEGFNGISIGLISMCSPIACIPISLFFAMIQGSASSIQLLGVDPNMPNVIFGIVVYGAAIITLFIILKPWFFIIKLVKGEKYFKIYKQKKLDENELCEYVSDYITGMKRFYQNQRMYIKALKLEKIGLIDNVKLYFSRKIFKLKFLHFDKKRYYESIGTKKLEKRNFIFSDELNKMSGNKMHLEYVLKNKLIISNHRENINTFAKFNIVNIDNKKELLKAIKLFTKNYVQANQKILKHYKNNQNDILNIKAIYNEFDLSVNNEIKKLVDKKIINFDKKLIKKKYDHSQIESSKKVEIFTYKEWKEKKDCLLEVK